VKIRYSITLDDLVAFNLYHFDHSPTVRRTRFAAVWSTPIFMMVAFAVLTFVTANADRAVVFLLFMLVFCVVWILAIPPFLRWSVKRNTAKLYGDLQSKEIFSPQELELTDTKLIKRTAVNESAVLLEWILQVARTDDHTFVFLNAVSAHIIPRASVDERDYADFVAALEQRVARVNGSVADAVLSDGAVRVGCPPANSEGIAR
jgi:hypothetical protein